MQSAISMAYLFIMLAIFTAATYSIGRRILKLFRADFGDLDEFMISTALGTGALIYFTILLGIAHMLYTWPYILLASITALLSFREIKHLASLSLLLIKGVKERLKPDITGALMLASLFFFFLNGLPTLAPLSEFDSTAYHLAFAKVYADNHAFIYQPTQIYTTMPQGMTMTYAIAELFHTPNLSALIAYSFGALASIAIYSIIRKRHSEQAALTAGLLFFTAPAIIERLPQGTVDTSVTFFFLAAIIVLLKYSSESDESRRMPLTMLFSILIGVAAAIKLTAVFAAAAMGIGIVISWLVHKRRWNIKHLIIFGLIVLALIAPWLIISHSYTGNPIYPQGQSIFGGKYLDSSLTHSYANYHQSVGLERNLLNTLIVPWNITFNSRPFGPVIGLTPFFIMILPLIFLFRKQMSDTKSWITLFAISFTLLSIQFWVHPGLRYMFPAIALLSITTGMIIDAMMKQKILKAMIFLLLTASLVFNAAVWYGINAKNIQYFVSGESDTDYYAKLNDHNSHGAQLWINANTPNDSVVMLFNEPRGYFLDRKYIISSPYQTYIDYNSMTTTAELGKRLAELNVSYILFNDEFFDTYRESIKGSEHVNKLLRQFLEEHAKVAYERNKIRVYRIERMIMMLPKTF